MSDYLDKYAGQAEAALAQLARQAPPLKFAFTDIGEQIIASLVKAADEQVAEAEELRIQVMQLAKDIGEQLEEQAKLLSDMNYKMRAFGTEVLEAHKKLINGGKHENPSP